MTPTDRLIASALTLVAANERIHSLRVTEPCPFAEEGDLDHPGQEECRLLQGEDGSYRSPSEDWCEPCRQRAENGPDIRVAKGDRQKAMARLLTAARAVRRELYVGLPGERKRCVALTAARKRQCPRLVAPGQEVCGQHAAVLSRLLDAGQREQDER